MNDQQARLILSERCQLLSDAFAMLAFDTQDRTAMSAIDAGLDEFSAACGLLPYDAYRWLRDRTAHID